MPGSFCHRPFQHRAGSSSQAVVCSPDDSLCSRSKFPSCCTRGTNKCKYPNSLLSYIPYPTTSYVEVTFIAKPYNRRILYPNPQSFATNHRASSISKRSADPGLSREHRMLRREGFYVKSAWGLVEDSIWLGCAPSSAEARSKGAGKQAGAQREGN